MSQKRVRGPDRRKRPGANRRRARQASSVVIRHSNLESNTRHRNVPTRRLLRVGTWKDAVIQIALITVGVIIALAFDGISTLWSQRALVREARANLTSEIQDNRKELQTVLMRMDGTDKQLQHGLGVVEAPARRPSRLVASRLSELEREWPNFRKRAAIRRRRPEHSR